MFLSKKLVALAGVFCFSSVALADVYTCSLVGKPVELSLFPKTLTLDYSPKRAIILQPASHNLAGLEFSKSAFGSSLWANYGVPQKGRQVIASQIQLIFAEDTGRVKMKLGTQGYRPIEAKGVCRVANNSDLSQPDRIAGDFETTSGSTLNFSRKFKVVQINPNDDEIVQKAFAKRSSLNALLIESGGCEKGKDSQPWDTLSSPARYEGGQILLTLTELQASRFEVLSRASRFCFGIKAEKGGWAKRTYRKST